MTMPPWSCDAARMARWAAIDKERREAPTPPPVDRLDEVHPCHEAPMLAALERYQRVPGGSRRAALLDRVVETPTTSSLRGVKSL